MSVLKRAGQNKITYFTRRHTIFKKNHQSIALYLMTETVQCNGLVGTIALKISLGDFCSIGTVLCGVYVGRSLSLMDCGFFSI